MELNVIAQDLGNRLGIEIVVSEEGSFGLEVDGMSIVVETIAGTQSVVLSSLIAQPPPERMEGLYGILLKANHRFAATAGSTLSLDPESGEVALGRILDLRAMDGEEFFNALEGFVNTLETWRETVSEFRAMPPPVESAADDMPQFGGMNGFMQV